MSNRQIAPRDNHQDTASVARRLWGYMPDGHPVHAFDLSHPNGLSITIVEYGAIVRRFDYQTVTNGNAHQQSAILAYSDLADYLADTTYLGAMIGPIAGRLENASAPLSGKHLSFNQNHGHHQLHGGEKAFHNSLWAGRMIEDPFTMAIEMRLNHPLIEQEGVLETIVRFSLPTPSNLRIDIEATPSVPTFVNITHHGYFNLVAPGKSLIDDHSFWVRSSSRLAQNEDQIPTGEIVGTARTNFDFNKAKQLGSTPYDHDFVINTSLSEWALPIVAEITDPVSGRRLTVRTDQPALHLYSGDKLSKQGLKGFIPRTGLCLEAQDYPNAANIPAFPSTLTTPNKPYQRTISYELRT